MSFSNSVAGLEQRHMICLVEVRAGEITKVPVTVNDFHAETLLQAGHLVLKNEDIAHPYETTDTGKAWVEEHARGMVLGEIEAAIVRARMERDRLNRAAREASFEVIRIQQILNREAGLERLRPKG
jgi:hypothetical protein